MDIEQVNIKVRDIFNGYIDKDDDGVFGYGLKLAIRPPYQREFVYNDEQSEAVMHTVINGYPLNVMYWVQTKGSKFADEDSEFEILDGQQRTLSLMKYLSHKFAITISNKKYYWDSLPDDILNKILDYELMIYVCRGSESEKLNWFRIVNIAGERLRDQELRNSVYTGEWLSDAKKHFSKRKCDASKLSDRYIVGDPNRQELLEKALKGICELQGIKDITEYMSNHRLDSDADELWQYFQDVIDWIEKIFPKYYSDMKGLDWCHLFNKYHLNSYNSSKMKQDVEDLHNDDEVQKRSGIYEFLLCRKTDPFAGRFLNLRSFEERDKKAAYAKQKGICPICHQHFDYDEMEGDHIKPWSKGGLTVPENCQMLCRDCNAKKTDKY